MGLEWGRQWWVVSNTVYSAPVNTISPPAHQCSLSKPFCIPWFEPCSFLCYIGLNPTRTITCDEPSYTWLGFHLEKRWNTQFNNTTVKLQIDGRHARSSRFYLFVFFIILQLLLQQNNNFLSFLLRVSMMWTNKIWLSQYIASKTLTCVSQQVYLLPLLWT